MASKTGSWKPATLKAPTLGSFIVVVIILIAVIEYLSQRAKRDGALVYANNVDDLGDSIKFGYLYLPTIIAVFITMIWTWIDLDAKRMEGWFQLSEDSGAKGEDSILLQYPYVPGPIAPFIALRRKHWAVASASTVTLLFLLIVVPFQSAIFNTETFNRKIEIEMRMSGALLPFEQQSKSLDYLMYFDIFGIVWNKQKVLPFTTSEYAVLPFLPTSVPTTITPTELWSLETQAFSTSLDCKVPKRTGTAPMKGAYPSYTTYRLEHNSGCSLNMSAIDKPPANTYLNYIGYWKYSQLNDNRGLEAYPGCSDEVNQRTFLAIATTNSSFNPDTRDLVDFTALFCTPKYHVQTISVTVNASSSAIVNMTAISERSEMPSNLLNTTHLEYLISTSARPTENIPLMLIQGSKMFHAGVANTRDPAAFAAGVNQSALPDIMQPAVLQRSFEQMHQLLFSQAFSTLTADITGGSITKGARIDTPGAIILVRTFAIIVEIGLALMIVMIAGLWLLTFKRKSKLPGDPSSIGNMISLVPFVGKPIGRTDGGSLAMNELKKHLQGKRFKLEVDNGKTSLISMDTGIAENDSTSENASKDDTQTSQSPVLLPAVRPSNFSPFFGLFLLCLIGGLIATIISLQNKTENENGIRLPTTNRVVLSILTNFVPTLFATLLEPIWLSMNRLLAMLQPFEELRLGPATYFRSIGATYASLPLPFVLWRALRSSHFVLVGVCVATILMNVLAVSFAGLFEEKIMSMSQPLFTNQTLLPTYTGRNIINLNEVGEARNREQRDHLYYADSNITRGNSLPLWVGQDYYYFPFALPSRSKLQNSDAESFRGFKASTYGFGVDVSCKPLVRDAADFGVHFEAKLDGSSAEFWTSHILANSSKIQCQSSLLDMTLGVPTMNSSRLSYNFQLDVVATNQSDWVTKNPVCTDLLVMGWVRFETEFINKTTTARQFKKSADNHVGEGTFLGCVPQPRLAKFEVVVDADGFILESKKLFDVADSDKFFDIPQIDINPRLPFAQFKGTLTPSPATFRNSTVLEANDWIDKFLNHMKNSTTLTDPNQPPPQAAEIAPTAEALYRQLFALVIMTNANTVFNTSTVPISMTGATLLNETRLFLNPVMYKLSLSVLIFQLFIAILFYLRRPKMFLPRLPLSIASILAYLDSSRLKEEFIRDGEGSAGAAKQHYFGYGKYEGLNGRIHTGIEIYEYVIKPVEKERAITRAWKSVFGKEKGIVVESREVVEPASERK